MACVGFLVQVGVLLTVLVQ